MFRNTCTNNNNNKNAQWVHGHQFSLQYRWDNHAEASVLFTWEEQQFKSKLCSSCDTKYDVIYVPFFSRKIK